MMLFVIVVHKAGGERFVVDSSLAPVRMAGNASHVVIGPDDEILAADGAEGRVWKSAARARDFEVVSEQRRAQRQNVAREKQE